MVEKNSFWSSGQLPLNAIHDLLLENRTLEIMNRSKNPLNKFGAKYFSQFDEDGIIQEIVRRLKIQNGIFAEFGVGDGLENNSISLLSLGWKGLWVGGEDLAFEIPSNCKNLNFEKKWVDAENAPQILAEGLSKLNGKSDVDLLCIDLDGNDYYVINSILDQGAKPKIIVMEYNGSFDPRAQWKIEYNPKHIWDRTNYFGASLGAITSLLSKFGYRLVCCNSSGVNAFFIEESYSHFFKDVPKEIEHIYLPPHFNFYKKFGHRVSSRTVELLLK